MQRNLARSDYIGKAGICSVLLSVSVACFGKFVMLPKTFQSVHFLPRTFEIGKCSTGDLECSWLQHAYLANSINTELVNVTIHF